MSPAVASGQGRNNMIVAASEGMAFMRLFSIAYYRSGKPRFGSVCVPLIQEEGGGPGDFGSFP